MRPPRLVVQTGGMATMRDLDELAMSMPEATKEVEDGRPTYADDWLPELARSAGLLTLGRASQIRPHFHTPTARAFVSRPRREHLIVLGRK